MGVQCRLVAMSCACVADNALEAIRSSHMFHLRLISRVVPLSALSIGQENTGKTDR